MLRLNKFSTDWACLFTWLSFSERERKKEGRKKGRKGSAKMNNACARSAEKYRIALLFTLLDARSGNSLN